MECPFCRNKDRTKDTKVIDSRLSQDGLAIRRRRECPVCNRRFTTYERIEESPLKVIKKDGSRVPFDRARIRTGLEKACYKRPVSDAQIEELISEVEAEISKRYDREVPSRAVGEEVIERLRKLDQVAYVRFASVYRDFKDVSDFMQEVQPMLEVLRKSR